VDPDMQQLVVQLADVAVRNSVATVAARITAAKARKRDQETINQLEQIVNDLLDDKNELYRIAQAYEQELVAQRISDVDVAYITETILPLLETMLASAAAAGQGEPSQVQQMIDLIKPVVSKETVTVLQLLGFNFRRALGEPLTELVSKAILAKVPAAPADAADLQELTLRREVAVLEVAKDAAASARLSKMMGGTASGQ
jgi:hypothetical protein